MSAWLHFCSCWMKLHQEVHLPSTSRSFQFGHLHFGHWLLDGWRSLQASWNKSKPDSQAKPLSEGSKPSLCVWGTDIQRFGGYILCSAEPDQNDFDFQSCKAVWSQACSQSLCYKWAGENKKDPIKSTLFKQDYFAAGEHSNWTDVDNEVSVSNIRCWV